MITTLASLAAICLLIVDVCGFGSELFSLEIG